MNPKTYRFDWKDHERNEKNTNMVEFFNYMYPPGDNPKIKDYNQPLLVVHFKDKKIYLPSELCFIPNLPEDFTKNSMAMRDIQELKTVDPGARVGRI